LKIWQVSYVADALTATSLALIYRTALSRPSLATPKARVAVALSAAAALRSTGERSSAVRQPK
jgi:hypothetical protein